jgi:DNA-binding transcriptional LysR family regulator
MSRIVGTYRFEIVGSPAYFARAGIPTNPFDLTKHACLLRKHPATGKVQRWPFAASAEHDDFPLPIAAVASTVEALVYLAEQGVGIACVPDFCVRRQVADGSLVSILREHIDDAEVIRAMWPSSRYVSPKLRVFIDFVAGNLCPKISPSRKPVGLVDGAARAPVAAVSA